MTESVCKSVYVWKRLCVNDEAWDGNEDEDGDYSYDGDDDDDVDEGESEGEAQDKVFEVCPDDDVD